MVGCATPHREPLRGGLPLVRILVPSFPQDVHAVEVALALRDLGHEVVLWNGGDFPTSQTGTLLLEPGGARWEVSGPGLALEGEVGGRGGAFDVVWYRRATPPLLPEGMHPGDRPVAQRECDDFVAGLWAWIAPDAFWVNPLAARARANLKLVQLEEARRAGLAIPRTLSGNDPARIRAFLEELGGSAVYKAFYPVQWEDGERLAVLLTSEVRAADLPPDDVLRLTPGIFQPRVPKRHELRVVVLGERVVTARLLSQENADTRLDWRARSVDLRVEPDRLPPAVERAVLALVRRLGLVFGCLDLIVTPEGEHVFLEVNPMGQFLWLEHANPEVRLLGPFCELLLGRGARGDAAAAEAAACDGLRHADWFPRAEAFVAETQDAHVAWASPYAMSDVGPAAPARTPDPGVTGAGSSPQGGNP